MRLENKCTQLFLKLNHRQRDILKQRFAWFQVQIVVESKLVIRSFPSWAYSLGTYTLIFVFCGRGWGLLKGFLGGWGGRGGGGGGGGGGKRGEGGGEGGGVTFA
jgi:hypothetical protein